MRLTGIQKVERLNFAMFLAGRSLSVLMSSVYTFAVGLYVLKMTGSGLSFAVTLSLQIVPTVLIGPFGGVMADRFSKKALVISTDTLNGVLFLILFSVSAGGLTLFEIDAATLLLSVSQAIYSVGIDSAVPNIVSKRNILRLNSTAKIVDSVSTVVSPGLGGILYAMMDIRLFVLLNGFAFLFSTATECLIHFRLFDTPMPWDTTFSLRRDLTEGIRYIRKTGWIKRTLLNFLVVNFFFALCYSVPVPYILSTTFHLPSGAYGLVQCFSPLGMILGALLVGKITGLVSYGRLMTITGVGCAACLCLLGLFPALSSHPPSRLVVPYYACLLAFLGLLIALIDIPFMNHFQTRVPENIRGRAISISVSAIKTCTPIGYLLSGGIMGRVPAFYLPLCGGILLLLFYILLHMGKIKLRIRSVEAK